MLRDLIASTSEGATILDWIELAALAIEVIAVAIIIGGRVGSYELEDWGGLSRYAPGIAIVLALFFMSLAGVPPLAGWFAKFVMFRAVLDNGTHRRVRVCTRCLRSGKVKKPGASTRPVAKTSAA